MVRNGPSTRAWVGLADGCGTVQYVCMFLSAGNPGMLKDIQVKVAAARKVFRILKARPPLNAWAMHAVHITELGLKGGYHREE